MDAWGISKKKVNMNININIENEIREKRKKEYGHAMSAFAEKYINKVQTGGLGRGWYKTRNRYTQRVADRD